MADNTLDQYKTIEELREFARAQQTVLIQLNKKIQKLEQERNHLKDLLEKSVPLLPTTKTKDDKFAASDEESIAREQVFLLRNISRERELTYEEVKKLETYHRILTAIENKKPKEKEVTEIPEEDLLKLAEGHGSKGSS